MRGLLSRRHLTRLSLASLLIVPVSVAGAADAARHQEGSAPSHLSFWIVGDPEGVAARFGADVSPIMHDLNAADRAFDRVLLALAEAPLTPSGIQERSGLAGQRVSEVLAALGSLGMVYRGRDGARRLTVPVISTRQAEAARAVLEPMAHEVARSIVGDSAGFQRTYEASKAPCDPPWNDVAPLILDKLVVDGAFHQAIDALEVETGVADRYSREQRRLPAFFMEDGADASSFGVNWYPFRRGQEQRELYVLHGALMGRTTVTVERFRDDPGFAAAILGIAPDGAVGGLTAEQIAMLSRLGWTAGDQLLVPVVQAGSIRPLLPLVESSGRRAAEVMFAGYDAVTRAFAASPYAAADSGFGDYAQICYHLLFSLVIEELQATGSLPPIPSPAPEHYGVYLVLGTVF